VSKTNERTVRLLNRNRCDLKLRIAVTRKDGTMVRGDYRFVQCCGFYTVTKIDGGESYTITTNQGYLKWTCSCPDSTHRNPTGCKHVRALKTALIQLFHV